LPERTWRVVEEQSEVVEALEWASNHGRAIVPLLGAGISVESGIPALGSLTQYLAKVKYYISRGGLMRESAYRDRRERYHSPSLYLQDFGWPDPHQLNAELWKWVEHDVRAGPAQRRALDWRVQEELLNDMSRFDDSLADRIRGIRALRRDAPEVLRSKKTPPRLRKLVDHGWELQGNWRSLLAFLSDANPDFADTLFQRLIRDREPSTAHKFLAFLTPLLGFRLFLTTNFDKLLEEALRLEGFQPIVYDVSRTSALPHHSLVQQGLSVVKLHGGAFGLRVGETLDQPLDEDSKSRLKRYLPERPILLVLGVGGWDRRVMDLVKLVVEQHQAHPGRTPDELAAVYWLHFESTCPEQVKALAAKDQGVCPVRTYSPGAFLAELHGRLVGAHPPSARAYAPLIARPIVRAEGRVSGRDRPLRFFVDAPHGYGLGASLALARLTTKAAQTHTPIWIDLEVMQTVEEVVADIFRQVRQYDTALAPLPHLTHQAGGGAVSKSVRRIYDALARGRYLVAFNAVGSFGRPPTFHHGSPEAGRAEASLRLTEFLWALCAAAHFPKEWPQRRDAWPCEGRLKDSILAFAVDRQDGRRLPPLYRRIRPPSALTRITRVRPARRPPSLESDLERYRDALLLITAFRRRRSGIALRQLLPDYLPGALAEGGSLQEREQQALELVDLFARRGYLVRVEGGSYWMSRRLRDHVYQQCRSHTSSRMLLQAGADPATPLDQLSALVAVHHDIATYCYANVYAASQDLHSLLEHLYHRISCLRYLTKLDAWLPAVGARIGEAECTRAQARLARASSPEPWPPWNTGPWRLRLRRLRLRQLLSLRHSLERERECLLSAVPADTLVRWLDWIKEEDLPRFWIESCLHMSRGPGGRTHPSVVEFRRRLEAAAPRAAKGPDAAAIEGQVLLECRELYLQLDHLKATMLKDKMDLAGCLELRSRQLLTRLGRRPPRSLSAGRWLSRPAVRTDLATAAAAMSPVEQLRTVEWLGEIWECLRWRGERQGAEAARGLVQEVLELRSGDPASDTNPEVDALRILALRHRADHELMGISPWDLRSATLAEIEGAIKRCRSAMEICDAALGTIEWAARDDYSRQRSYLHSLRGRAHYLCGEFHAAHRQIDLSQMGLAARIGADREALAASLLRLAECLMVRADDAVMECCLEHAGPHAGAGARQPVPADLSVAGLLCLIGGEIRWPQPPPAASAGNGLNLRAAAATWLEIAAALALGQPSDEREAAYARWPLDADQRDRLAAWEAEWPVERLGAELRRAADSAGSVWRRCISNWSRDRLARTAGDCGDALQPELARANGRLQRAREVLDRAESMLLGARQNLEWWACLYQLRAQIQVELLLLMITSPIPDWQAGRRQFIARLTDSLQKGLWAVRQGLDVMLPGETIERTESGEPRDLRVTRILRMWVELMLCGGYLTRLISHLDGKPSPGEPVLWHLWRKLHQPVRIVSILASSKFFLRLAPLGPLISEPPGVGIEARAAILAVIKSCLRAGCIAVLVDAQRRGTAGAAGAPEPGAS
jgi:NAD-dependent SIR2 family protein deacetylase